MNISHLTSLDGCYVGIAEGRNLKKKYISGGGFCTV